jgi:nicotinamidase-related amidase
MTSPPQYRQPHMREPSQHEARLPAWQIAPREYARQEQRRGRRHAYEQLEPTRTALIVVDMVHFFAPDFKTFHGIIPNINQLARTLRTHGGLVVWVLPQHTPPTAWAEEFYGPSIAGLFSASGGTGAFRERLWPTLDVADQDLFVEKQASSAFFPGLSPLPGLFREQKIDTVLITGTVTNVCCEASARDAATLGFRVVMVADGNAAGSDEVHNATLHTIYRSYGDVRPTQDIIRLLEQGDESGMRASQVEGGK